MSSPFAIYPSLKNKVVFVTGGASGIGEDIVRAFTTNEAKVAFVDVMEHRGLELATDTGALFFKCDVTDIDSLKAAIAATHAALGPISVLVNNAANDDRIAIDDIVVEYWDWSQAINLRRFFLLRKLFARKCANWAVGLLSICPRWLGTMAQILWFRMSLQSLQS